MDQNPCVRCGSEDVIPDLSIVDHGYMDAKHELAIELHERPGAWLFKGTRKGVLKARVCGSCGHVELSVDEPRLLWKLYRGHG